MSKITAALETSVATVIANRAPEGQRPSARQRANVDRAFAQILKLIAPRIRHFIRQYGLVAHWDDAEQCCAIAVHRAIEAYDPGKAQFTTFVNWQIRGELQSLRFRLMTDQRPSAQKVQATTVSLNAVMMGGSDGEDTDFESMLVDEEAVDRTESGASAYLARAATQVLIDEFVKKGRTAALDQLRRKQGKRAIAKAAKTMPEIRGELLGLNPEEVAKIEARLAHERRLLEEKVFGEAEEVPANVSRDQVRQLSKRAGRAMAELAGDHPRFRVMADYGPTLASGAHRPRGVAPSPSNRGPGLAA